MIKCRMQLPQKSFFMWDLQGHGWRESFRETLLGPSLWKWILPPHIPRCLPFSSASEDCPWVSPKGSSQSLHTCFESGLWTSLMVQWLRLHAFSAGGPGSIPDEGTGAHWLQLRVQRSQLETPCATVNIGHPVWPRVQQLRSYSAK